MTYFYGQYVGFGAGHYTTPFTPGCFGGTGGGTQWGYACGGINQDYIFRNSYSSDVDATDIGNLTYTTNVAAGHSSATSGYCSGGTDGGNTNMRDDICRFTFAAAASIVAVGDLVTVTGSGLTRGRGFLGGGSSSTHGFSTGGSTGGNPGVPYSEIDIFPFASDVNSADHGDLSADRMTFSTASALTVMYTLAGEVGYTYNSIIDKIIFATSTTATNIADHGANLGFAAGHSSTTHGYSSGGFKAGVGNVAEISKFSFAADTTTSTQPADITLARRYCSGSSKTTHGYTSGGYGSGTEDRIDKFLFSNEATTNDVGNLTAAQYGLNHVGSNY